MKRIMALLMGIIMLVSAFAGCSNTSPTPADTDAPSSGDNTPAHMDPADRNIVLPRICEGYEISED